MIDFNRAMEKAGIPYSEYGLTAIDAYYGYSMESPVKFFAAQGSMVDLAKVFEAIEYPSLPYADVSVGTPGTGAKIDDFRRAGHRQQAGAQHVRGAKAEIF